ncbi:ABC transporter ATP-binding protein [Nocardiopsis changdeensis]|uniref:ABC transporter ATP-binding protein n=1 Tax=Nocardiopsis changdeensis TaxID=2831969 RepID=A0ABX8BNP1_9ACTN|nr:MULTISPECIES: ABC transporter ATP-binding protein [Nocardiopsis]QUX23776.1 ABC transporter ATP-binding protein [Nocardiopsis changdeensis]QYX39721.1 ABC transporter ATP-binding protein [Nocardiopsis sp. MT53]
MGIRFDRVSVAYGDTVVLDGLDLTVEPGEFTALLGPSGSGKTTALRAVAGFVRPASGRVLLNGRDVTDLPPHARGVGMVVQSYALFPHMRVDQNVAFGLRAQGTPRREIPGRVAQALEMTGMAGYARRHPRELSGGQQQRVAIARALAIRPKVLLLDEPLSALDARLRSDMLGELARLHRELPDVTVLYVTHDQSEALTLADRVAVLDRARLREYDTPRALYARPRTAFTARFVGGANLLPARLEGGRVHCLGTAWEPAPEELPAGAGEGAELRVCLRPHRVVPGGAEYTLRGEVSEVQWRGSVHRITALVGGHPVTAEVRETAEPPAPGAPISLGFTRADAVLLEPEPEEVAT